MVFQGASGFVLSRKSRSVLLEHLKLPLEAMKLSDNEEFDFNDVFGPAEQPQPQPQPAGAESKGLSNQSASGLGFLRVKDPEVICSRSHSLVGPSPRPGLERQPSKFSKPSETVVGSPSSSLNEVESGALSEDSDGVLLEQDDVKKNPAEKLGTQDFELLRVVGQGAFGKVFQVRRKGTTDDIYAMKVMRKDKIIKGNHVDYMKAERDILTKVDHPFIVQLRYSFQTKSKLYLILDFINGGHLFFQLYRQGIFSEELARIYTAEIVSAVTHLHKNGIIHRDLKPENILMDAEGHVMLTDFGLAKEVDESMRSNSMCGTTEYMAPEIILSKGHDKAADWWSVGVLLYEMVTGQPPFTHNNRQKLQDKIIKDKIKLPSYLTSEAHSLLKGLLQKDPSKRLGSGVNGSDEIKRHKWFKIINWKKLDAREIQPTFRPNVSGKDCIANFDERWTNMPPQDSPASTPKSDEYFKGYTYVAPSAWLSGPEKESH
ncbi:serine/threonine-protein kinase AtPK2/AtPK19 [Cryptomeria japonica]|uniref:serine/threonine-protein kinase AtPK2/AtPK19 n=1 Tax=Cryptomeria japonica TaxID=3369 RepID=UPI0025AB9186|nr:serine/threonine-protein kinase AtPK2/AtPK19 [Cryptomeria japonica]